LYWLWAFLTFVAASQPVCFSAGCSNSLTKNIINGGVLVFTATADGSLMYRASSLTALDFYEEQSLCHRISHKTEISDGTIKHL